MAVGLLVSIVPSYWILPPAYHAGHIRQFVSQSRRNMRELATAIEKHREEFMEYPGARTELHNDKIVSLIDPIALNNDHGESSDEHFAELSRDLFSYRTHVRLLSRTDPPTFDRVQYGRTQTYYFLWSRGPDLVDEPEFLNVATLAANGSTTARMEMVNLTYDPTNGTTSRGEVFRIGPRMKSDNKQDKRTSPF